jgi:acyl-CoA synthetase (AMP-forming)/AMP-acid ligase II
VIPRPPLHYPDLPVHAFLQQAADLDGEATALLFEDKDYSYRELDGVANSFTHALTGLGFAPQQRAALVVSNRPEWIMAQHGIMQAGGSVVMPNPLWKELELRHAFTLTNPNVVVADGSLVPLVEAAGGPPLRICLDDPAPAGWLSFWQLVAESPATRPSPVDLDYATAEAALPFSSGTTGMPKAVRHSHRSLVAGIVGWKSASRIVREDRLQFFLPLFHIYGIAITGCAVAARASVRLFPRFDLDAVLGNIEEERITIAFAAAPIAVAMANHPKLETYNLSSLRYMLWAATPISVDVANRVSERSGLRWLHAYGASEAVGLHCNPVEYPESCRLDTPGLPVSDTQVRIVDLDTAVDVAGGREGEIVVKGPQVMMGYLPETANDAAFLPGGWFRTGDVGWVEPGGWLHITDRAKEMLKVSGFTVSPVEIESVLLGHPSVADCAVYGIPHDTKGEVPRAAVMIRPDQDVTGEELIRWVADRLATYKHLADVRFVTEIPRTASGKVLRRVLKDQDQAANVR